MVSLDYFKFFVFYVMYLDFQCTHLSVGAMPNIRYCIISALGGTFLNEEQLDPLLPSIPPIPALLAVHSVSRCGWD